MSEHEDSFNAPDDKTIRINICNCYARVSSDKSQRERERERGGVSEILGGKLWNAGLVIVI